MIIEYPVATLKGPQRVKVEIQIRTIAMDFWASLEHKVRYKKEIAEKNDAEISKELKQCADEISQLDLRMQDIRRKIDFYKNNA